MINCKTVQGWSGLTQFGINMLTGEACRFSQRLLCDLNETGRDLVADYLGITSEGFTAPWNSSVSDTPAVASVLLHRESLNQLAEFAMFRDGALAVAFANGIILGLYEETLVDRWAEYLEHTPANGSLRRNYAVQVGPHQVGSRNVHMATGRAN